MRFYKFLLISIVLLMQGCSIKQTTTETTGETLESSQSDMGIVILSSYGFFDRFNGYYIVGEIINNSDASVQAIQLAISLYDTAGISLLKNEIGESVDSVSINPHFDVLDIGERSTFSYYFDLSGGLPASYTVTVMNFENATIQRPIWATENVQIFDYGNGYLLLTGEIVNLSSDTIGINHLVGGVRDDTGKVLSVEALATYVSTLAPAGDPHSRDRTPFSVRIPIPSITFTQWGLWCEAEFRSTVADIPLEIEEDHYYIDEFHVLHYIGMIENSSSVFLSSPVVAGLYMEDGSVLDVSYFFPVAPIPPGTTTPFDITNFGSNEWTNDRVSLISNLHTNIDFGNTEAVTGFQELSSGYETIEKSGTVWAIHGSFTNTEAQNISEVVAIISVMSADDRLIATGYGFSYPSEGKFLPGSSGEYDVSIFLPVDILDSNLHTKTILLAETIE